MRRGAATLLVVALVIVSIGVSVLDRRRGAVRVASGDGLAVTLSRDGGVAGVSDHGRDLPRSGARGGFSVRAVGGQPNLLANPGFEEGGGVPERWSRVDGGGELTLDSREPHGGGRSVRISLPARGRSAGLTAVVEVEPETEYVLQAWIRTEGILPTGTPVSVNPARVTILQEGSGGTRADAYAFGYTDDSPWTRHEAGFRTHGGVRSVRVLVEIRGGSGTAWFDDLRVARLTAPDAEQVEGAITRIANDVRWHGNPLDGVALDANLMRYPDHLAVEGVLEGTDARDHAAQVSFTLPVDTEGWTWGDDVRRSRTIQGDGPYTFWSTPTPQGGSEPFAGINQIQRTSIYPFGGISRGDTGLGIGVPMSRPRASRIQADADGLTITFDLGVSPDAAMSARADFGFVLYRADGRWGFRALAQRYYELFPSSFERRTDPDREGAWFFAPPLDSLPDTAPRDFGLGLNTVALGKAPTQTFSKWGTRYVPWDNERHIYANAYTHQWAFFLPSPQTLTYEETLGALRGTGRAPDPSTPGLPDALRLRDEALGARFSTARDVNGRYVYEIYRGYHAFYQNLDVRLREVRDWSSVALREQVGRAEHLAEETGGHLDGIHMDSTSGARRWGATNDFDREHWAAASIPLTFSYANGRVSQLGILSMYAHIARLGESLHDRGKILSANFNSGWERALGWVGADQIDYFGIEQGLPDKVGGFDRVDRLALVKRTLAWQRPVTSLDYAIGYHDVGPAEIDARIQQSLFYGIYPGAWVREENEDHQTVPTWSTPENRAIFAKYSMAFRALAEGGWEPVTLARSDNPKVWVERYGHSQLAAGYLTLRNETDQVQSYRITLDNELLGLAGGVDLLSGRRLPLIGGFLEGTLAPRTTLIVALESPR